MTDRNLNVVLSTSQITDLIYAWEDYREDFRRKAIEAQNGFGLDVEYWESRANDIEGSLQIVQSAVRATIGHG
ncbi:MAG: hypothetical protein ACTIKH_13775 [Glutamicibacter ardleyensis]|uniref:hypothetical protein n=1 Tax=Glutamicibacter ardleyensis TaxID=225894 RepID=UPI003F9E4488